MSNKLIIPDKYTSNMNVIATEIAIKKLKDYFEKELANELNLTRVSAPLLVRSNTGINDSLNGIEQPVSFSVSSDKNSKMEIVQSLAKWKRIALYKYEFMINQGLYTDMNAIRPDEDLDNIHSIYVDQWDWEKVIERKHRNENTLKNTVKRIYEVFRKTEEYCETLFSEYIKVLPNEIYFITTQELEDKYPNLTPKERENAIAKEKKAVFIMKIGDVLNSGIKHDGRSPDYDDWSLNGDIIFWYPLLNIGLELSSMGIRVDPDTLVSQLHKSDCEERLELEYHRLLLEEKLPYTIGGGIGQSRICMFFLNKAHIGEVQASVWPKEMLDTCKKANIFLL